MSTLLHQATTLHNQGRLDEAEQLYRSVLASDPRQPDALALLGLLLATRKDYAQAISFLERAIQFDPSAALFRFYLGGVYFDMGENAGAEGAYREALARQPSFAEAHVKLALVFEKQNRLSDATKHLCQATQIKPDYGVAWAKLSEISFRNGVFEQAEKAAAISVCLMPNDLTAHSAHALALDSLDREEEAVASLRRAVQIKPDFSQAWDMLGSTYQKLGRLDEAGAAFRKAIEVAGCDLENENGREVAEEEYSVHHWNLALLELLRGDFHHGFAHYRARFKNAGRQQRLSFPRPIWRGEDLRGKKILVVGEQGLGDVLMLCRFATLLKARGASVVLMAHDALAELLKLAKIADKILCEAPEEQGDFDFQTSIFDLPCYLGIEVWTIPSAPYLPLPPPDEATKLPGGDRPRIGVVWAGKKDYGNDRRRSLALATFAELFNETGAQFFNLTRELKPGDAEILTQHSVVDLSPMLNDFLATARFVAQLDLVITCDTAVAHLAGGMGKQVWTLLPFAPDWRWLTARDDSPWYPTMRLFRQSIKANWSDVVARVRKELATFLRK